MWGVGWVGECRWCNVGGGVCVMCIVRFILDYA